MRVLVLGGGAREHALAWRLARDEEVDEVLIAPGNGGTPAVATTIADLPITDPAAVARHAARERYDLVVIGGGPAGISGANTAAIFGKRVALVEKLGKVGGGYQHRYDSEQNAARDCARAFGLAFAQTLRR